jgi:hypothetical protein
VSTSWRVVAGVCLLIGIGELVDSFFIGWGAIAALVFAALFFLGFWLTRNGRLAGPIIVGVMCVLELAAFPTFKRTTTFDWVVQIFFVVASAIGVIAVVAVLFERRRTPASSGQA